MGNEVALSYLLKTLASKRSKFDDSEKLQGPNGSSAMLEMAALYRFGGSFVLVGLHPFWLVDICKVFCQNKEI